MPGKSGKSMRPEKPTRVSERMKNSSKSQDENANESETPVEIESIEQSVEQINLNSPTSVPSRPHLLWNSKKSRSNAYQLWQNFPYLTKLNDRVSQYNWSGPIGSYLDSFKVGRIASPFDRRITALEWQPKCDVNTVASASKNGDIFLLRMDQPVDQTVLTEDVQPVYKGGGPGHYIAALKWDSVDLQSLYAANMSGAVEEYDIEVKKRSVVGGIPEPDHYRHWWTSLDESMDNRLIVAGNTNGIVVAFDKRSYTPVWQYCFHRRSRVQHLEFSRVETWLLASSGNDKGAKLWDVRMLRNNSVGQSFIDGKTPPAESLDEVKGDRPVNIATFNFRGDLLLTSDQHHFIHVYQGPTWKEIVKITHPHRQFQHLTPIRASWHPLSDVILIGRYPDPNLSSIDVPINDRTIDVYCGQTGKIVTQLFYPKVDYITTITKMNNYGSMLACASGSHLVVWTPQFPEKSKRGRTDKESDPDDSENDLDDPHEDFKKKRKSTAAAKKKSKKEKKVAD